MFLKQKNFNIVEQVFDFEKHLDEKNFLKDVNVVKELKLISAIDTMDVEGEKQKNHL
ncbi:MAG: hypothetical protein WBG30_10570 [Psychrilyobacter sp.]|uniref:hypothetical protein n=1 Tax=Psychrilyobacter sp. TaxID=2586924 RepID=UPI003C74F9B7